MFGNLFDKIPWKLSWQEEDANHHCTRTIHNLWTEKSIKIENTVGTDKNGHSMSSPKKQCLEQFPMPKIQNSAGGEISKGGQQDGFLLAAKIRLRKRKACDTLEQSVLFLLTRNLPDTLFPAKSCPPGPRSLSLLSGSVR